MWSVAAWTLASPGPLDRFGTLKGTDFVQFYIYGLLTATSPGRLFDVGEWHRILASLATGDPHLLYVPVYPPTIGLLFAPFATLSWRAALVAWTGVSAILYAFAIWLLLRTSPRVAREPIAVALFALGWPVFAQLVLHGQVSTLFLLVVAGAWPLCRAGRPFIAGLVLGLLALKPSLLLVPLVVMAVAARWRVLAAMTLSGLIQLLAAAAVMGWGVWVDYARTAVDLLQHPEWIEPKLWQAHAAGNAFALLLGRGRGAQVAFAATFCVLVWLTGRAWRGPAAPSPLAWALLVLAALVGSPHLYVYDLVIMAAAFIPIVEWTLEHPRHAWTPTLRRLVAASYVLPLFAPLAAVTRVQVSVLAFGALFWACVRASRAAAPVAAAPSTADPQRRRATHGR